MSKTTKRVLYIVIGGVVAFIVLVAAIVFIVLASISKTQKADYYEMGKDSIPSVKAVVGERKIASVSKAITNGVTKHTYGYLSQSAETDVLEYSSYLVEQAGFAVTDLGQKDAPVLARTSVEDGKVVLVIIEYTASEYYVTLQKGEGTLTVTDDAA